MTSISRKIVWALGILLFVGFLIAGVYFFRKESYQLNKNVRLVWMRVLTYRELSLHRGCAYRIQFNKGEYQVSVLHHGPEEKWQDYLTFPYVDDIEVATPGFTVVFDRGNLVSYYIGEKTEKLRPSLILYFFHHKNPACRRGIQFMQTGRWKALWGNGAG
ncbi:MAG: hypothetical protein QHH14_03880 [Clostridiales bacterium]|nr:hypothetical protein [Clostridiales bacterium]